jgi:hypothetical protein
MKPFSSLFLLTLLLLFACKSEQTVSRQLPSEPETPVSQEAEAGSAFAEAELSRLYSDALLNCYPYMFSELIPGVEIHDKQMGLFMGGIKGMLLYSGMPEAVTAHLQAKGIAPGPTADDFYDIHKYEQFAGNIQAFEGGEAIFEDWQNPVVPFHFYRPEIVRWGYQNLIPDPKTRIAGIPARDIYQQVFARFFRLMAASYLWLQSNQPKKAQKAYQQQFDNPEFDGLSYLEYQYGGKLPLYESSDSAKSFTPAIAIGFWLRRSIDGSQSEFWEGLSRLMKAYDGQWFAAEVSK